MIEIKKVQLVIHYDPVRSTIVTISTINLISYAKKGVRIYYASSLFDFKE